MLRNLDYLTMNLPIPVTKNPVPIEPITKIPLEGIGLGRAKMVFHEMGNENYWPEVCEKFCILSPFCYLVPITVEYFN